MARRVLFPIAAVSAMLLLAGVPAPVRAEPLQPAASGRVADTEEAVAAALDLSRVTFPESGAAERVVIARGDVFADTLAGAALAGTGGPILYAPSGPDARLPDAVLAEIARVLGPAAGAADAGHDAVDASGPGGPCAAPQVWLLGGTVALPAGIAEQVEAAGYCTARLEGPTRVETALAVAREVTGGGRPARVLLASAGDWPDAATAGAYAAATGTPVLLTPGEALSEPVAAYLAEIRPDEVVLLGGTHALSQAVEAAVAALAPVRRIAGPDRGATAVAVVDELFAAPPGGFILVDGYGPSAWVHALAAAPMAARNDAALIYTRDGELPGETLAWLGGRGHTWVLAAGTPTAVSDTALDQAARRNSAQVPSLPADAAVAAWLPPGAGWPTASTTGVPPGVSLRPSGTFTVTRDGTVIDGLDVAGSITVRANNVTIRNTRVRSSAPYLIRVLPGYRGTVISDVDLDGLGNTGTKGIAGTWVTVRRADIARVGDGVQLGSDSRYEGNYIHHLAYVRGAHSDGMQAEGASRVTITGNTIDAAITAGSAANSAVFLKADFGPVTDVVVRGNALNGGNYTVFGRGAGPGSTAAHPATRITIADNVFGRNYRYGLQSVVNVSAWRSAGNRYTDGTAA